ncbi:MULTISPECIES: tRNA 2-selenouridine(34) synthase MnmH [unclassified Roseateles]|uniref:tRNA 2-selenouridine(34) synthase MnmH n=1 Tax=unclassified Roseateles TaxID=2626991 RepID=UPI00070158B2|nr:MULTISPECIES: tRNA 2-selenouridine(34) synthase MnmH [unclassified Roseateles]KQW42245.1 tRNA 2-selenouridine synthase [Pelomonas sp. Root405]KRA68118.1 tRNA 2-selenouridine synthase [Pelomonas sp. Root662]
MSYTTSIGEAVAELDRFDAIVDVRSPAEFAEDHMPGAINWPVLDDQERHDVGLLYASSPFEARKLGSALVARNIARHIESSAVAMPKTWRPLVYCWRGGQRSGAMHWFLGQIGFRSRQLVGGYKAYRAQVREDLIALPERFDWRVLCGRTGSGKTRLLHALAAEGAQVLDLEALAAHRGSVLGALPDAPQPSQKAFDSVLWQALRGLDATRPVFVESESRKIGRIRVPETLLGAMQNQGGCVWIAMPEAARVELLLQDYGHFAADPDGFCRALDGLVELRGRARVEAWQAQARAGDWAGVFAALMRDHYDPGYERSLRGHFPALARARELPLADGSTASMQAAARSLMDAAAPAL